MPDDPSPRHSVSVAAAIFDASGRDVLLIKRRDNGNWEIPGGVLELGETIDAGLRREVREETGAEIEVGPLTGVYKNMRQGVVALVFRCGLQSRPQRESPEAVQVHWWATTEAADLMEQVQLARVLDACCFQGMPNIRSHDGLAITDA